MSTTTNRKPGRPRKQDNPTPETAATRERWRKNNNKRYLKKKIATMESKLNRPASGDYKSPFLPRAGGRNETGNVPMEEYHTQLNQAQRAYTDHNMERYKAFMEKQQEEFSRQMQAQQAEQRQNDLAYVQALNSLSSRKLIGSQVSTTDSAMDHFHDTEGQTSPAKIPFSLDTASVDSGMSTVRTGGPSGNTGRTGGFITPAPKFRPIVKDCTEEDLEEGVQYVESLTPTSPHSAALAKAEAEARAEVKARAKSPIAAWFGKCFGMDSMEEDAVVAAKTEAILSIPDEELFGYEPDMIKMFLADANELGLIHSGHARGAAELPAETVTLLARKVWFEANKINGKKKMAEFVVGKLLQEA